jgi:hypothetical protein
MPIEIFVPSNTLDSYGQGMSQFLSILEKLQKSDFNAQINIDMTRCRFLNPSLILPLMLYVQEERWWRDVNIILPASGKFAEYCMLIYFHGGLKPESFTSEHLAAKISSYASRSYLPIVNFPAVDNFNANRIRRRVLSGVNEILVRQIELKGQMHSAVMYLIDEAIQNIIDHSRESRGYILTQYYRTKKWVDVCIADRGIGLLRSYQNNGESTVTTHNLAMEKAVTGKSTKDRAESRGFGISTSREMLAQGIGGKYSLLSGTCLFNQTPEGRQIINLPPFMDYPGSIVTLRIPLMPKAGFEFYDYVNN